MRAANSVSAATIALKESQAALTDLRRKHLEGEYVEVSQVRGIVTELGNQIQQIMKEFPAKLRRRFPKLITVENEREIFDFYSSHVCEATDKLISNLRLKPTRHANYVSKPGPKPKK